MEGIYCNYGIWKVLGSVVDEGLVHVCNQIFYVSSLRYIDACEVLLCDDLPSAGKKIYRLTCNEVVDYKRVFTVAIIFDVDFVDRNMSI